MNHNHSDDHKQSNGHDQHPHHDSKHMWWMMLGCLLPMLVLFFAQGSTAGVRNILLVVAGIGMLALHFFGMRGGHQHEEKKVNE